MEDSSHNKDREIALALAELIGDHKGIDPVVMDLSSLNAWTDYFVIATVTSSAHLQGMLRHIKEYTTERGVDILRRQRKTPSDEEWSLVDLGPVVVHLMTARSRSFYELERLWIDAPIVFGKKA